MKLPPELNRVVFLGDSITDGGSYMLLVQQALCESGYRLTTFINGGIGGDTAAGMLARLERDALAHQPTLVTLNSGVNDLYQGVSPEAYKEAMTAIVRRLKSEGIPVMLLTVTVVGAENGEKETKLENYSTIVRDLALTERARLADVRSEMQTGVAAGENLIEDDGIHPNWAGHCRIARAVLDGLGFNEVALPEYLSPPILPGILPEWKVRAKPDAEPLTPEGLNDLNMDEGWITVKLPQTEADDFWWIDQERQRGFVIGLEKLVGPAEAYRSVARIDLNGDETLYFNLGGTVQCVWLGTPDGRWIRLFSNDGPYRGWHPGMVRILVEMRAGANILVVESGPQFFVSLTPNTDW